MSEPVTPAKRALDPPGAQVKLQRLRRIPDDLPRWWHPHGWVIQKCRRDWALGSITRGATHQYQPKTWYEIHRYLRHPRRVVETFGTLREARAWCDEHQ